MTIPPLGYEVNQKFNFLHFVNKAHLLSIIMLFGL